ncbi:hypothetical protein RFI_31650 [Reticulomyxa filosa]|uniref:Uncharacterized protein n=1 Tax=Reticulomyxa filosa TaxID=46433 RepID=X6LX81_RETFI|nr:hypothetical protein RFI_31650 [Reticulomyxa filosa]|eukprot:ETO05747.1 hypothetical protein RFI_31650 [Reticulomyxa filosa]
MAKDTQTLLKFFKVRKNTSIIQYNYNKKIRKRLMKQNTSKEQLVVQKKTKTSNHKKIAEAITYKTIFACLVHSKKEKKTYTMHIKIFTPKNSIEHNNKNTKKVTHLHKSSSSEIRSRNFEFQRKTKKTL